MKPLPFIGALLLSSAPVHASRTFEEIIQPCNTSEEAGNACDAMAIHFSAISYYTYPCRLEEAGKTTPEVFSGKVKLVAETKTEKENAKVAYNTAIKKVKNRFPNCPVKPFP